MVRLLATAFFVGSLVVALLPATPVAAKGRELNVYPAEATWGETVFIEGFNWPGDTVPIYARFATTRAGLESAPLDRVVLEAQIRDNGTFLEPFVVNNLPGQGEDAPPGWIEFMARVDEENRRGPDDPYAELRALLVVTAKGRPEDGGFIEGRIETLPGVSAGDVYAVWAPASNAGAYRFEQVGLNSWRGFFYRTDYLEDGDWFVGMVDIDDVAAALNSDLWTIRGKPPQLDREVTWRFRKVAVRGGRPVGGVDFLMGERAMAERQAERAASLPNAGGGTPRSGAGLPRVAATVGIAVAVVLLAGCGLMRRAKSGGER